MTIRLPRCYGIIPARYQSSRFPGKPLAEILGRPMLCHVHERASRCQRLEKVVLATDDERIFAVARERGVDAIMTRTDHPSGTDRVFEAARVLGAEPDSVVVNIQGDEPALEPAMLDQLVAPFADPAVQVTTLARRITAEQARNPDQVKAVFSPVTGDALYFSRAPVPFDRDGDSNRDGDSGNDREGKGDRADSGFWGHVGLYAFRMQTLERFTALPPGALEQREKLEQLRLLEHSIPIRVIPTEHASHGVDRPEDIAILESILGEKD